jgi:hypothetical protein
MTDWIEKDNLPPALPKGKKRKRKVKERQLSLPLEGIAAAKASRDRGVKTEVRHESGK